jgi:uracil-DNA glycosylase
MDGKLGPEIIESLKTQTKTYQVLPLFHPSAILRDKDNERGYKAIVTKTMAENKELISNCVGRILI